MISHLRKQWIAIIYLHLLPSVNLQVAMYPMFPPAMQVGVPMPMPVPIVIRAQESEECRTTTTTTTTERSRVAIAYPVPMPVPMPMPFAFPAFPAVSCQAKNRPKNCPPCPPCLCTPSCTPSFFSYCSPCHKKCRCRSKEDTPTPIPPKPAPQPIVGPAYGVAVPVPHMFGPPPVVVIPFPPPRPNMRSSSRSSSSSDYAYSESTDDSSSSSYERRRKRRKKFGHLKKRPFHRRQFSSMKISDNELVKPVLTYLTQDGDVKLKRRLSHDEAAELMDDKPFHKISVVAGEDERNVPRILITSTKENEIRKPTKKPKGIQHRRKQVVLKKGAAEQMLGEGKKELVFRAPSGKKISNLSVSFHISE